MKRRILCLAITFAAILTGCSSAPIYYVSPTQGATVDTVIQASKLSEKYRGKNICTPNGTTVGNISDALKQYSKAHPDKGGKFSDKDLYLFMSSNYPCSSTQKPASAPDSPRIIMEQNGKVTNVSAEGNLASHQVVGCIPLAEVQHIFTPADIHKGVGQCIEQGKYDYAANLYLLAFIYGIFDSERVTDKTAGQAILVLNMNTFSKVPQDKKIKADEAIKHIAKDSELLGKLCGEINKIGPPDYYPSYMILHGVKAFTGNPHDGALVRDFDTTGVWKKILSQKLKCPS